MKKRKVGRPKLADKKLKKKSYIMLGISALLIMILLSGTLVSLNILPNFNKTKGSVPIYKDYKLGDLFCLNGEEECFYIISDNGDTVTALAQYSVNTNMNKQSENPNGLQFTKKDNAAYGYWTENYILKEEYGESYPAYVFDENSNLWQPVQNYKTYIQNLGYPNVDVRLLSYDEVSKLGCNTMNQQCSESTPVWVYSTNYWLGSASDSGGVLCDIRTSGLAGNHGFYGGSSLRPVITILKSDFAEIIGYEPEPEPETTTTVAVVKKEETTTVATPAPTKNKVETTTTKKKVVRKATTTTSENKVEESTTTTTKVNNINKVVSTTKVEEDKEKSVPVVPIAVGGGAATVAGISYAVYVLKFK